MKSTGMKEPLVKGEFTTEEARMLIKSLFRSKIQMHTNASFSNMLRTGSECPDHNSRKMELIKSLEQFEKELSKKSNANAQFNIKCELTLKKVLKKQ